MKRRRTLNQRLDDAIERFTPTIAEAFRSAIQGVKDTVLITDLVGALEAGDPIRALRVLGFNDAAMRPLTAAIEQAFENGGITAASAFPRLTDGLGTRAVFRFDVRNSRAEAWLRDRSSRLVSRINEQTLENIRNTLNDGMRLGTNPRETALNIVGRLDPATGQRAGGIIGLTPMQERWISSARAELADPETASNWFTRKRRDKRFDSIVRKSIEDNVPLDTVTINKLTTRYSDSMLKLRGDTIARTESIAALNQSAQESLQQAVDNGSIDKSAVKRIWDSAGDDGRTRESHLIMDGQAVGLNEPFTAPDGSRMMYPGDTSLGASAEETINCRCRVRLSVDWLAGAG